MGGLILWGVYMLVQVPAWWEKGTLVCALESCILVPELLLSLCFLAHRLRLSSLMLFHHDFSALEPTDSGVYCLKS